MPQPDSPTSPKDFALVQSEADPVHCFDRSAGGREGGLAFNLEQQAPALMILCFKRGSRISCSPSPSMLILSTRIKIAARRKWNPPGAQHVIAPGVDHGAPGRFRAGSTAPGSLKKPMMIMNPMRSVLKTMIEFKILGRISLKMIVKLLWPRARPPPRIPWFFSERTSPRTRRKKPTQPLKVAQTQGCRIPADDRHGEMAKD